MPLLAAHDALLSPTAPAPAPAGPGLDGRRLALRAVELGGRARRSRCRAGWTRPGLPLALQLVQAPPSLERLLGVAAWCEQVLAFTRGRPGA